MFEIFKNINVDWMGMAQTFDCGFHFDPFAGLISAVGRQVTPGGTNAFNLGVDFQGGTVITAKFRGQNLRKTKFAPLAGSNAGEESVIQSST
jgi:preprotein translocase subunit SecF